MLLTMMAYNENLQSPGLIKERLAEQWLFLVKPCSYWRRQITIHIQIEWPKQIDVSRRHPPDFVGGFEKNSDAFWLKSITKLHQAGTGRSLSTATHKPLDSMIEL